MILVHRHSCISCEILFPGIINLDLQWSPTTFFVTYQKKQQNWNKVKQIMSTDVVWVFLMWVLKVIVVHPTYTHTRAMKIQSEQYLNEAFLWSKRIGFQSFSIVKRSRSSSNMMMDRKKENGTMNSDIFYMLKKMFRSSSW